MKIYGTYIESVLYFFSTNGQQTVVGLLHCIIQISTSIILKRMRIPLQRFSYLLQHNGL